MTWPWRLLRELRAGRVWVPDSEKGLELTRRVFTAWRAYQHEQHEHHDRDQLKDEIAPIQTELQSRATSVLRLLSLTRKRQRAGGSAGRGWCPVVGRGRGLDLRHG